MQKTAPIRSAVVLALMCTHLAFADSAQQVQLVPWLQQLNAHPDDADALMYQRHMAKRFVKPGVYLQAATDVQHWQGLPRSGALSRETFAVPEYEAGLRETLDRHPESPFADDAALILARGRFYWYRDVESAIAALLKVAEDYSTGTWIADNRLWYYMAGFGLVGVGREHPSRRFQESSSSRIVDYFVAENPNYIVDEVYMTIAGFYAEGYAEPAERQVDYYNRVIARHADRNRFEQDLQFLKNTEDNGERFSEDFWIFWIGRRPEDQALLNLVDYHRSRGDLESALERGRRFIEKMNEDPFACRLFFAKMAEMEEEVGHEDAAAMYRAREVEAQRLSNEEARRMTGGNEQ
jgi:hypothetical protein